MMRMAKARLRVAQPALKHMSRRGIRQKYETVPIAAARRLASSEIGSSCVIGRHLSAISASSAHQYIAKYVDDGVIDDGLTIAAEAASQW